MTNLETWENSINEAKKMTSEEFHSYRNNLNTIFLTEVASGEMSGNKAQQVAKLLLDL